MKRFKSADELRLVIRRALAYGYAALEEPTTASVREAQKLVTRVLSAVDEQLLGGELGELVAALRRVASQLTGLSPEPA